MLTWCFLPSELRCAGATAMLTSPIFSRRWPRWRPISMARPSSPARLGSLQSTLGDLVVQKRRRDDAAVEVRRSSFSFLALAAFGASLRLASLARLPGSLRSVRSLTVNSLGRSSSNRETPDARPRRRGGLAGRAFHFWRSPPSAASLRLASLARFFPGSLRSARSGAHESALRDSRLYRNADAMMPPWKLPEIQLLVLGARRLRRLA